MGMLILVRSSQTSWKLKILLSREVKGWMKSAGSGRKQPVKNSLKKRWHHLVLKHPYQKRWHHPHKKQLFFPQLPINRSHHLTCPQLVVAPPINLINSSPDLSKQGRSGADEIGSSENGVLRGMSSFLPLRFGLEQGPTTGGEGQGAVDLKPSPKLTDI